MQIRPATLGDAAAIAAAHVASWQATYRGVVPDEVLDGPDLAAGRLRLWERWLGPDAPAGHAAWVAEVDGEVVAFIGVLPSRDDDADETTGEVWGLYARREAWGTGVGRALMATGVAGLRAAGSRSAILWVLDSNARARRFYERAGFAPPDGATKSEQMAGTTMREVRYRRDL